MVFGCCSGGARTTLPVCAGRPAHERDGGARDTTLRAERKPLHIEHTQRYYDYAFPFSLLFFFLRRYH